MTVIGCYNLELMTLVTKVFVKSRLSLGCSLNEKSLEAYSCNIDVFWDLSSAKFGLGPEDLGGFYVGVAVDKGMFFLLGDMKREAFKKKNASP
ncbi:hypothetical protein V5N11_016452 [Cardamine amara subsp. amara]|uniref:Uncharacterized protein n=1 Tax=Cardamine amara subsp. amara TaxID=228776 RepID=A0ABD1AE90_CARAN